LPDQLHALKGFTRRNGKQPWFRQMQTKGGGNAVMRFEFAAFRGDASIR